MDAKKKPSQPHAPLAQALPAWAEAALDKRRPRPLWRGGCADSARLVWWQAFHARTVSGWDALRTHAWDIPTHAPCYQRFMPREEHGFIVMKAPAFRGETLSPQDKVREAILFAAVEAAWEASKGISPIAETVARAQLIELDGQISALAESLQAKLLYRKSLALGVDDAMYPTQDPLDLFDALDMAGRSAYPAWHGLTEFERASLRRARRDQRRLLRVAGATSQQSPEWPDLLGVLAARPSPVAPPETLTRHSYTSDLCHRVIDLLDKSSGFPVGFVTACVKPAQLAELVRLASDDTEEVAAKLDGKYISDLLSRRRDAERTRLERVFAHQDMAAHAPASHTKE